MGKTRMRSQSGMRRTSTTENTFLKENNSQLAKALAEAQLFSKQMMDERNYCRKELFNAKVRIEQLENYISKIRVSARESINCIVALTSHATDILNFVTCAGNTNIDLSFNNLKPTLDKSESCAINKTQAVKPMIDGHVIYSPTINLKRVSERSCSQIQNRRSTNNRQSIDRVYNNGEEEEEENDLSRNESFEAQSNVNRRSYRHISERLPLNEVNNDLESDEDVSEESTHSGNIQLSINNIGLTTIQEQQIEDSLALSNRRNSSNSRSVNLPGPAGQVPILSGVFSDVRVYLSPVDPLSHITKVRGSSKSHKFKSSDVQHNRSSEAGSSTDNSNVGNRTQVANVESSSPSDSFAKVPCSSTPITSCLYNQSTSNVNETNNSVESNNANINIRKRRRTTDHTNPKKLMFNGSFQTANSRSYLNDDDPLEGPSNLLESSNQNKIIALAQIGLSPTVAHVSLSSSNDELQTSKELRMHYPTKRKLEKRKKSTVVSSKVTKREKSTKYSNSPQRSPPRKLSKRSSKLSSEKTRRIKFQTSPEGNNSTLSSKSSSRSPGSTSSNSPIKRKRPRRAASKENYKEPSLTKKLRRSK